MLFRLVITFLPSSKHLLISWLQSPSAVILEPPKIKFDTVSSVFPSISHEVMGPDAMILVFWMLSFKPTFSLLFHFHQESFYYHLFKLKNEKMKWYNFKDKHIWKKTICKIQFIRKTNFRLLTPLRRMEREVGGTGVGETRGRHLVIGSLSYTDVGMDVDVGPCLLVFCLIPLWNL